MTVNVHRKRRYKILSKVAAPGSRKLVVISGAGRRLYTLLTFVTAAGVFAGTFCGTEQLAETLSGRQWGFGVSFVNSMAVLLIYIGLCFFGGLSAAGAPGAYLLCFFKGLGTGALCACIFAEGAGGVLSAAGADIIPFEAMSIALLIFAARENLRMSGIAFKRTFGESPQSSGSSNDLRLYLKKFGVIFLASAAAAAVDAAISGIINS